MTTHNRKAGLPFILVAALIDVLGVGLIVPVLPKLIATFEGITLSQASAFNGVLIGVYALMSFLFASAVGSLSDRFGRRPVLLLSLLGLGLDYVIIALAPNFAWLVVGRVLAGIFGATEATASAYIADVSAPQERAKNFGLLGATFGIGFIVGPLVGGFLGNADVRLPFWFAAALSFLNLLYGLFVLPESLPLEHRRPFSWVRANPVGSLLSLRRFPGVPALTAVYALTRLALNGLISVWVLYTGYRLEWSVTDIGISLAVTGVCLSIVQGALVGPAVQRFGEGRTALFGLTLSIIAYLIYGLATEGWIMYTAIVLSSFTGLVTPAVQGAISSRIPPEEQGVVQGALSGLDNLANVVAPPMIAGLFAYLVAHTSTGAPPAVIGVPLFLCALFEFGAWMVAQRAFRSSAERVAPETAR